MSLVVKKRKKEKRVHFNQNVEIKQQNIHGHWSLRNEPVKTIPFTSIFNQLLPFVEGDVNLIMSDIVLLVLKERLPSGMAEKHMLEIVLEETYERQRLIRTRGWVQMGASKVRSHRVLERLIAGLEEANRDLDEHYDLYDVEDESEDEEKQSHSTKRRRLTYEILNDLKLNF